MLLVILARSHPGKEEEPSNFWNRCFEPNLRYIWMSVLENRDKVFPFS